MHFTSSDISVGKAEAVLEILNAGSQSKPASLESLIAKAAVLASQDTGVTLRSPAWGLLTKTGTSSAPAVLKSGDVGQLVTGCVRTVLQSDNQEASLPPFTVCNLKEELAFIEYLGPGSTKKKNKQEKAASDAKAEKPKRTTISFNFWPRAPP
jgi:hypothetical protein